MLCDGLLTSDRFKASLSFKRAQGECTAREVVTRPLTLAHKLRLSQVAPEAVPPHLEHLTEWRGLTDGVSLQHLVELASERFQWRREGSGAGDAERSLEDRHKDDKQTQTEGT